MAITRMTSEEIAAAGAGRINRARLDSTTQDDIRQQMIEDDEDPDAKPRFEPPVLARDIRRKLGLTQPTFARLHGVPIATLRNWEQNRFAMEPSARALLKLVDREPEAALRALCDPRQAA